MKRKITIAGIQIGSVIGDVENNVKKAINKIDEAAASGAQIICLPELFNTGYFCHNNHQDKSYFKLAEPLTGYTIQSMSAKAQEHGAIIVAPIFEKSKPGVYYNSAVLINENGSVNGVFRKVHIPWSYYGWEKYYFRAGYHYPVFNTSLGKIGIMICYDRFFPEVARSLAIGGAELIIVPAGAPKGLNDMWEYILRARAHENQVFLMAVDSIGKVDSEHYEMNGESLVVDPKGDIVTKIDREERVMVETIDLNTIDEARINRTYFRDRKPFTYNKLVSTRDDLGFFENDNPE